jgi:hypothetical protein
MKTKDRLNKEIDRLFDAELKNPDLDNDESHQNKLDTLMERVRLIEAEEKKPENKILRSVTVMVKLEAMKAANHHEAIRGCTPKYTEEHFDKLLEEL